MYALRTRNRPIYTNSGEQLDVTGVVSVEKSVQKQNQPLVGRLLATFL